MNERASATLLSARRNPARRAAAETQPAVAAQQPQGRVVGYTPTDHALIYSDQIALTPAQAAVYDRIAPIAIKKVLMAQQQGLDEFELMSDWEWPDLLRGLSYRSANIVGNVREGQLPTWSAIESLLQRHGYRVVKAAQPWRLIARR